MKISVILACAGSGTRANLGFNKLRYDIGGMSIFEKTLSKFIRDDISQIVITSSNEDLEYFTKCTQNLEIPTIVTLGGATRQESIFNALQVLDANTDIVVIHDGARPFVTKEIIDEAIAIAKKDGSAIACTTLIDSLRKIDGLDTKAVNRKDYLIVQTPQVFKYDSILRAHNMAREAQKQDFLDDASIYEAYIGKVSITKGSKENVKITNKDDLKLFTLNNFYVGCGWDTHELVENRKLILGGIEIPHTKGLLGHSDADVLTHAIMDALLSASHNKDIGHLFPDTDEKYKGISSLLLLKEVVKILKKDGYKINNISAVIMAQKPKLAPHLDNIQKCLANEMGIDISQISLTSTTTEKLGLVGKEEAISVNAYCSLYKE